MRIISPNIHGIVDYLIGFMLMISAWIFGYNYGGFAVIIPFILGFTMILSNLNTDHRFSLIRLIPMHTHLTIDLIIGIILIISPWLFGFSYYVYLPHVVFGLLLIVEYFTTETTMSEHRQSMRFN